jgi:hypothetical protein
MGSSKPQISMAIVSLVSLVFPAAVIAATPPQPPPDTPSISQYVEQVPTSGGGSSPGVGNSHAGALPPKVANTLRSRHDPVSQQLEKVATSSGYGAPQRVLPKAVGDNAGPEASNALSAAVSAVSDSGGSHVIWLLLALVFVTIAMVWAAARPRSR